MKILFMNNEYLLKGNYLIRAAKLRDSRQLMSAIKGVSSTVIKSQMNGVPSL